MIGLLIAYMAIRLFMIFVPFRMAVSITYIPEKHFYANYLAFAVHFIVEAAFCVISLYIIALLKFIGVKRFVLAAFYIMLIVEILFFLTQILNLLIQLPFSSISVIYTILGLLDILSIIYLVAATFWIKNESLSALFKIYSFSLFFIYILQRLYFIFIPVVPVFPYHKTSPYQYLINFVSYIPDVILLVILCRTDKLFTQTETNIPVITD
jgi:hypothetical protein